MFIDKYCLRPVLKKSTMDWIELAAACKTHHFEKLILCELSPARKIEVNILCNATGLLRFSDCFFVFKVWAVISKSLNRNDTKSYAFFGNTQRRNFFIAIEWLVGRAQIFLKALQLLTSLNFISFSAVNRFEFQLLTGIYRFFFFRFWTEFSSGETSIELPFVKVTRRSRNTWRQLFPRSTGALVCLFILFNIKHALFYALTYAVQANFWNQNLSVSFAINIGVLLFSRFITSKHRS